RITQRHQGVFPPKSRTITGLTCINVLTHRHCPELRNLTLEDLNPKALVAKNLLSAESLSLTDLTTGFDLEEEPPGSAAGETSKKPGESVGPGSKSTTAGHRP
ncbi:hypothetical protein ABZV41_43500, partial [Streptomyces sp. NPDC005098]